MPGREKLAEFTAWCAKHITGDEKDQAQIFSDRFFQTLRPRRLPAAPTSPPRQKSKLCS